MEIRFSHIYPKLWGQSKAKLLAVEILEVSKRTPELLEYDTKTASGKYYPLPDGQLLQLVFLGNLGIPFCTLRRATLEKMRYYSSNIGEDFDIIIPLPTMAFIGEKE